jgi:ABC-2 type transport system ATP-binding protein
MATMVRLDGIRKTFGALTAVDRLTIEIHAGEVFGLLGPNGAGKTTAIRMMVGQLAPDGGRVEVDGAGSPRRLEVRRKIGVAPQSLALYMELTGEQNVRFFGRMYGLRGRQLKERSEHVLAVVGLSDRCGDRAGTYSGGMLRRLNLAIALVHDPTLIVLDEPTTGVDPQSRNAIFEFVGQRRAEGRTVVYTTHYMEEAQRLCDRVAIIDYGKLLALDTVEGLIAAHGKKATIVAERIDGEERIETEDARSELTSILQDKGVLGVRVERPNLESVFLELTGRRLRD